MPEIRNLSTVLPGIIEVETPQGVFRLRDDIGAVIGLYALRLNYLAQRIPSQEQVNAGEVDMAAIRAAVRAYEDERLTAVAEVVRHTPEYGDMSDADVALAFAPDVQDQVLRAFFTSRLARSQPQPSAQPPSAPAATPTPPPAAPEKRARKGASSSV